MIHTVRQGECLSSIANQYGFFWETLWNLDENASLRDKGRDPNVLLPGDQVFIPEKRVQEYECASGQSHTFTKKGIPTTLNLKLLDGGGQPRGGLPYRLEIDGLDPIEGETAGDGTISEPVSPAVTEVLVRLNPGAPEEESYRVQMRTLNPADDVGGAQARLRNLGMFGGDVTGELDDRTRAALRRFQLAAGLDLTGELDAGTQAKLIDRHGC